MATALGISSHTVKAWEAGRRTPTPRHLEDAARLLGVEPTTLNSQRDPGQLDLQGLRESAGLSVRAAADRLRTDPKTLRRVEAGEQLPPDPTRMRTVYHVENRELAAAFGRSLRRSEGER